CGDRRCDPWPLRALARSEGLLSLLTRPRLYLVDPRQLEALVGRVDAEQRAAERVEAVLAGPQDRLGGQDRRPLGVVRRPEQTAGPDGLDAREVVAEELAGDVVGRRVEVEPIDVDPPGPSRHRGVQVDRPGAGLLAGHVASGGR